MRMDLSLMSQGGQKNTSVGLSLVFIADTAVVEPGEASSMTLDIKPV